MDYVSVLSNAGEAGIFSCPAEREALNAAAREAGLTLWEIDLAGAGSKLELLERLRQALPLPEYCADNWDALDEALNDVAWEQPVGVMLTLVHCGEFAHADADNFETALEVFDMVAESCYDEDIPFWVFIEGVDAAEFDLPTLGEEEA